MLAEDIADPKHPLRYHQFLNDLKHNTSPFKAPPQDNAGTPVATDTASRASSSSQEEEQGQSENLSEVAGTTRQERHEQQAEAPQTSDQANADAARAGGNNSPGVATTTSSSSASQRTDTDSASAAEQGLMNLIPFDAMSLTLSRGGPCPGGQVSTAIACSYRLTAEAVLLDRKLYNSKSLEQRMLLDNATHREQANREVYGRIWQCCSLQSSHANHVICQGNVLAALDLHQDHHNRLCLLPKQVIFNPHAYNNVHIDMAHCSLFTRWQILELLRCRCCTTALSSEATWYSRLLRQLRVSMSVLSCNTLST